MMGAPGVTNLISSTTIASTTTSETVPPSSTVSNHANDFLSVIKFYCPNTQIILLNYNVSGKQIKQFDLSRITNQK